MGEGGGMGGGLRQLSISVVCPPNVYGTPLPHSHSIVPVRDIIFMVTRFSLVCG